MSRTHRHPRSAMKWAAVERFPLSTAVAALVCLVLILASAMWLGPQPAAHAAVTDSTNTRLTVTAGGLGVVGAGAEVTFTAVVQRADAGPIGAGRVQLRVGHSPLADRGELAAWLDPEDTAAAPAGAVVTTMTVRASTASRVAVTATVPADSMKLAPGAVYPIEAVYAPNADSQEGTVGATAHTTIVADGPGTAGSLATVAPLTVAAQTNGVISSDDLARLTADDGELTARLTALQHRPVSIALDPMIPASIRVLGESAPPSATRWLARLAAAPNEVFALQYADADIAGQSQAGIGLLQPISLDFAIDDSLFLETAEQTPGASPTPAPGDLLERPTTESLTEWPYSLVGIGWPAEDTVTAEDLDAFANAGLDTTILDGSAVTGGSLDDPSGAHRRIDDHQVLVADEALTAALRQAAGAATEAIWAQAMSDLFAQLALRAELVDAQPVLASLDRVTRDLGWFDATMSALADQSLVAPASLEALLRTPAATDLAITDAPEPAERIARIAALNDQAGEIDELATAAKTPEVLTGRYRANLLALLATSWLADPAGWEQSVDQSLAASTAVLDDVRLAPMSDVQMFGGQVAIPITVVNDLSLPVTVRVQTVPSNARLVVDSDIVTELAAGSQTKVLVPVTARVGNGKVTVGITLFNEDMSVQLDGPEYVVVTVRADWESFGTLILAILVVGFFGVGIWRSLRRRRKRQEAAANGTGDKAADTGRPDPDEETHDEPR